MMIRYFFFLQLFVLVSCADSKKSTVTVKSVDNTPVAQINDYFDIVSPQSSDKYVIGSEINIELVSKDLPNQIDSVQVILNNQIVCSSQELKFPALFSPQKVGKNKMVINAFISDGTSQSKSMDVFFLSDIMPKELGYKVVETYPHSIHNFTEGLIYYDGKLLEGTGLHGKSSVIESDLKTGKVLRSLSNSSDIFGEGITVINDKIIQLTYKAQVGFVYDKKTFQRLESFDTSFSAEGWGLTTDGEHLLMSNGSSKIFFLDPIYYSYLREIQVCDNKHPLEYINELELVGDILYANIWQDNRIAQIDISTGKVLAYIDLSPLVPKGYMEGTDRVLNGIALYTATGNLLVTGKNWDTIYEIKLFD